MYFLLLLKDRINNRDLCERKFIDTMYIDKYNMTQHMRYGKYYDGSESLAS